MTYSSFTEAYSNPVYYLQYTVRGTGVEISLNDIPILTNKNSGTTESQKPVPESIIDGKNTLSIKTFPLNADNDAYPSNAYVDAVIVINENNGPTSDAKPVVQLRLNPGLEKNELLNGTETDTGANDFKIIHNVDNTIIAERSVDIKSPYPEWVWQKGKLISDNSDNYESLLRKYLEIYDALKSEDLSKIHPLYSFAAQEYANAYNYLDPEQGYRIMGTDSFVGDPDWVLGDTTQLVKNMPFHLHIYANGKLASIIDNKHGKEPIIYIEKGTKNVAFQKFGFYKNSADEWIMIR